jgi:hypothetical protein
MCRTLGRPNLIEACSYIFFLNSFMRTPFSQIILITRCQISVERICLQFFYRNVDQVKVLSRFQRLDYLDCCWSRWCASIFLKKLCLASHLLLLFGFKLVCLVFYSFVFAECFVGKGASFSSHSS